MSNQHSESFEIWLASIRINTEGKSLIMKMGPVRVVDLLFTHTSQANS